jgi:hypothetical protein
LQWFSDRLLYGENPLGWHLTNIYLQAFIAFATYSIVYKITAKRWLGLIAALVFAISPANHEDVAWISGRTHPFGLMLSLGAGALLFYAGRVRKKWAAYLVGGYFLLLSAYLTYEISFIVPFALLLAAIIFGPRTKQPWLIAGGSFLLLALLVIYRRAVLGGTMGSVGQQNDSWLFGWVHNLRPISSLFGYSREIQVLLAIIVLFGAWQLAKNRAWLVKETSVMAGIYFLILSILAYLPFSVMAGVAPRFLYSSLFFFIIATAIFYSYIVDKSALTSASLGGRALMMLVFCLLVASAIRTWQVSERYAQVAATYEQVLNKIVADFPVWPQGKDMLFCEFSASVLGA